MVSTLRSSPVKNSGCAPGRIDHFFFKDRNILYNDQYYTIIVYYNFKMSSFVSITVFPHNRNPKQ